MFLEHVSIIVDEEGYAYLIAPRSEMSLSPDDENPLQYSSIEITAEGLSGGGEIYHQLDHRYIPTIDWQNNNPDEGIVINNRTHYEYEGWSDYIYADEDDDSTILQFIEAHTSEVDFEKLKVKAETQDGRIYEFDHYSFTQDLPGEAYYFYTVPSFSSMQELNASGDQIECVVTLLGAETYKNVKLFIPYCYSSDDNGNRSPVDVSISYWGKQYSKLNINYLPNGVPYFDGFEEESEVMYDSENDENYGIISSGVYKYIAKNLEDSKISYSADSLTQDLNVYEASLDEDKYIVYAYLLDATVKFNVFENRYTVELDIGEGFQSFGEPDSPTIFKFGEKHINKLDSSLLPDNVPIMSEDILITEAEIRDADTLGGIIDANYILQLNENLAGLRFSVNNGVLSITDGSKTWTLS